VSLRSRKNLIGLDIAFALVVGFLMTTTSIKAVGQEHVLHAFNGRDGVHPNGGVIFDAAGNLYGTTLGGGGSHSCGGCGTVFKLSPEANGKWTRTVLHSFNGKDGFNPFAGVIFDAAGNLYGTTWIGGSSKSPCNSNCGVVFKLSPGANGKWTETVLHYFNGNDGANPYAGLIFDAAGNLYGTTWMGGTTSCGCGTVFKLSPGANGKWRETVLHSFNGEVEGDANPYAGVIFDAAGNLYGTTFSSIDGESTVFRLTPGPNGKWTHSVLHNFSGKDGAYLYAGVVLGAEGNLYGATDSGGAYGNGTVFELAPTANDNWTKTVLHDFNGKDGANPDGGVILDAAGNLYGTTFGGGKSNFCANCGTVFELSPGANGKWTETVLHSFNGHDGEGPFFSNLIFDTAGNLYGTTVYGGNLSACTGIDGNGCGVVF
jgi:uncharacterized repeat protein (TIGR03803 family)